MAESGEPIDGKTPLYARGRRIVPKQYDEETGPFPPRLDGGPTAPPYLALLRVNGSARLPAELDAGEATEAEGQLEPTKPAPIIDGARVNVTDHPQGAKPQL